MTDSRPIFVVGMNGSGTSMLTESLGRHPDLYAFPGETRMIPHFIAHAARQTNLDEDQPFFELWHYVINAVPDITAFDGDNVVTIPDDWQHLPHTLATILDTTFNQFAAAAGKSRWCEKSPNNTEHMLGISAMFPHAKFVHIIRDGRDCAASTNRRQHRNPSLAINRWRLIVQEAIRQGERLGTNYLQLRYEDLTADPNTWMREICEFTELGFHPNVLESGMPQSAKRQNLEPGDIGRIEPNSMKWKSYFSEEQLKDLEGIAGHLLKELGYPTLFEPGSRDVGRVKRHAIRFVDYFKANERLRSKLSGENKYSWGEIYRHFLASTREYFAKKY